MSKLTLTPKLLNVLLAIGHKKALAITESNLDGFESDWLKEVRQYYFSLPDSLLNAVSLKKNENCARAIICFTVPQEWLEVDECDLSKFEFCY